MSDRSINETSQTSSTLMGYDTSIVETPTPRVDSYEGRWWVLHTRPRNEKVVAQELRRRDVRFFLPLVRYRRIYGNRIKPVSLPLFPGYVFLCGCLEDRLQALQTNRIARVLEVVDQQRLRKDLAQIQHIVESDEPIDLYPRLRKGSRCRVVRGSLMGLEGVVLRRRDRCRIYIAVEFLGQSAEVEIHPDFLEVID